MIEKYFNGVIEQVYSRIGQVEKNIVMARYSNDFSVLDLDTVKRYLAMPDGVFSAAASWNMTPLSVDMNLF